MSRDFFYPDEIIVDGELVDTREGETWRYVGYCVDEAGITFYEKHSGQRGDDTWDSLFDESDIHEYMSMLEQEAKDAKAKANKANDGEGKGGG